MRFVRVGCLLMVALAAPAGADPARDLFFDNLRGLCGARFEGVMTFPTEGQDTFTGKLLVATVASCDEQEVRVPFQVGEDRSRTWLFRRTAAGLELKHDHRHADGTPDAVTMYGGMATGTGSAWAQSFPADAFTAKLIPAAVTNVWTVSLSGDHKTLTYHLERDGRPRFTAVLGRVDLIPKSAGTFSGTFSESAGTLAGGPVCPPAGLSRGELEALAKADFVMADAEARNRLALALVDCLDEADPALRDDIGFTGLSSWLRSKALSGATVGALANRLAPVLAPVLEGEGDAAGFAKPFAALVLSEVVRADRLDPVLADSTRSALVTDAARYLRSVRDYRGFDSVEGWRHGVAHGADLVLQLAVHPKVTAPELRTLLAAVAAQVAPPGGVSYVFGEPERLARAVFFAHQRGALDDTEWDRWFAELASPAPLERWSEAFRTLEGLARRHNTLAFLHAVAFAARANPNIASGKLGVLADRELTRVMGG